MISASKRLLSCLILALATTISAQSDSVNLFAKIDTNGDKQLTEDELEAYYKSINGKVPAALWEIEDKNKDRIITWEEFSGPKGAGDEF
jgi:Ca2+-binding EF-hand superfamily protein